MITTILENYSLKNYNTFGIDVKAKYFSIAKDIDELKQIVNEFHIKKIPILLIGGGSNILFTKNFDGIVIKPEILGVNIVLQDNNYTYIKAGAGIEWDNFVDFCVSNNFYGIENLAHIPGSVGACPIQNIGAYGVEVKDVIHSVEYIDIIENDIKTIDNLDCSFGYRDSIFKKELKNKIVVTNVIFKLANKPNYKLQYGEIENLVKAKGEVTAKSIKKAITEVRKFKLPDPKVVGNGGSFFKNPIVENSIADEIRINYPEMPSYHDGKGTKIPAAWLIEKAGWKGKSIGKCGVHHQQALVLVNYGDATGNDVLNLSKQIIDDVYKMFNIKIVPEINII